MNALVFVKVSVVLVAALLALASMRRAPASLRHHVVALALAAAVMIPLLEAVLPAWTVLPRPVTTVLESTRARAKPIAVADSTAPTESAAPVPATPSRPGMEGAPARVDPGLVILLAWSAGAGGLAGLLVIRVLAMGLAVRRAVRLDEPHWSALTEEIRSSLAIHRPVELRVREKQKMPAVWGMRRAVVLLPGDCHDWSEERRRAVLTHELAHVARGDVAMLTLGHLACALHWFNPLIWMLQQRLAIEREHACDDLALTQGMPATRYADHLLTIAATHRKQSGFAPVMAARSQLEERILAILDTRRNRKNKTTKLQLALGLLALATLIPLSSLAWAQLDTAPARDRDAVQGVSSDSSRFAERLDALGIERDDTDRLIAGLNEPDAVTRGACAWALGSTDDPRAVGPLIQATSDGDAVVRQWAIRSLGDLREFGGPQVADALIARLSDGDAEVRQWAVRKLDGYDGSRIAAPLAYAVFDDDAEVREWTVRTLGNLDDSRAQAALRDSLLAERNAAVREWSVRGLDAASDPASVDALIDVLGDENPEVRQWAVRGLADACDGYVVDALVQTLGDTDDEVRQWSVRALGRCGDSQAIRFLRPMLDDTDAEVREWADRSLEKLER